MIFFLCFKAQLANTNKKTGAFLRLRGLPLDNIKKAEQGFI